MNTIELQPIGILHGDILSRDDAPKNFDESDRTGVIEIAREYLEAMKDLEVGECIVVLFWLHQSDRSVLKVYPRGDRSRGLRGVFSTRSPARPNPIAISELTILSIQDNKIEVQGLDMMDGTPVLDIKKKLKNSPAS